MMLMAHERAEAEFAGGLLTPEARLELAAMGLLAPDGSLNRNAEGIAPVSGRAVVPRVPIEAPEVLNEAHTYEPWPASFSRGLRVDLGGATMLLLSGTASVDEHGRTVHVNDFPAQCLRTFRNLTRLLVSQGASWHDVVRTSCYLRDIERDYEVFNRLRTFFFSEVIGLDPLPASTGIQARLCRSDLLVEIEGMAIIPNPPAGVPSVD